MAEIITQYYWAPDTVGWRSSLELFARLSCGSLLITFLDCPPGSSQNRPCLLSEDIQLIF